MGRRITCFYSGRSWIRFVDFFQNLGKQKSVLITVLLLALIINVVGLGISTIVFVIEKLVNKFKYE